MKAVATVSDVGCLGPCASLDDVGCICPANCGLGFTLVIARSRTLSSDLWCVCLALVVLPVLRVERR